MVDNKRSMEICDRLNAIAAELRDICREMGKGIDIMTHIGREGKTATTLYAAGYRFDHFYDGYERLSYGQYTVGPEQIIFGELPRGLEETIRMKKQEKK